MKLLTLVSLLTTLAAGLGTSTLGFGALGQVKPNSPQPVYTQDFSILLPFASCGYPGVSPQVEETKIPGHGVRTEFVCHIPNFWSHPFSREPGMLRGQGEIRWIDLPEAENYPYWTRAFISESDGPRFETLTVRVESWKLSAKELEKSLKEGGVRAGFRYTGPLPSNPN